MDSTIVPQIWPAVVKATGPHYGVLSGYYVCNACGAVITEWSMELHFAWHERVNLK